MTERPTTPRELTNELARRGRTDHNVETTKPGGIETTRPAPETKPRPDPGTPAPGPTP